MTKKNSKKNRGSERMTTDEKAGNGQQNFTAKAMPVSAEMLRGDPVLVLLGPMGVGKSLLATALSGLPLENDIFQNGDSAHAVTLETVCHRARWFGRQEEEWLVIVEIPGVGDGEGRDAGRLARAVRILRDLGRVNSFLVCFNSEQPRLGSVLQNLLQLMEEFFGRRFWRHVMLVFTRYYTDPRSARRRGSMTQDKIKMEFSTALSAQFPHALAERVPPQEPFPCYFVDSEAAISDAVPEPEHAAVMLELERLSVMARAIPPLATHHESHVRVSVPSEGNSPSLQKIPDGTWVEIDGLTGSTPLNGSQGTVVEFQASRKRYVVELSTGSRKLVKASNLKQGSESENPNGLVAPAPGNSCKAGEVIRTSNIKSGAVVQRGPGWKWGAQDGGEGSVGCVLEWNAETRWAKVRWNSGHENTYRIGADESFDLSCASLAKHTAECQTVLSKGPGAIRASHLKRTFGYVAGVRRKQFSLFDVRDEICLAVGGFKHGQLVTDGKGHNAVVVGVKPINENEVKLFFHLHGAAGAGIFNEEELRRLRVIGRQKIQTMQRKSVPLGSDEEDDNEEMAALARKVRPNFLYKCGVGCLQRLSKFDITDEVCGAFEGLKHGQVVRFHDREALAVVIGVQLDRGQPKIFFHEDGHPGAGTYCPFPKHSFAVVGTRDVPESRVEDLGESELPISESMRRIASNLQCDFSYPSGPLIPEPDFFDIRDEVCMEVGGFRHGEVVQDQDGDESVVIGVKCQGDERPQLWFHMRGKRGAGVFPCYHHFRRMLRVVGKEEVRQVLADDPMFIPSRDGRGSLEDMLSLLRDAMSAQSRSPDGISSDSGSISGHDSDGPGLPDVFELEFSFNYYTRAGEVQAFDIRDEVCMAVGGFHHGDVLREIDGDESVVIGVALDPKGKLRLWLHVDGAAGAGISTHHKLLRLTASVVGKRKVPEVQPQVWPAEFISSMRFTFRYPVGLGSQTSASLFDIQDETCMRVCGFKHREILKLPDSNLEVIVVGVKMDDGVPEMFFQVTKPKRSPGAGKLPNIRIRMPERLGFADLQEVLPENESWMACSTQSHSPVVTTETSTEDTPINAEEPSDCQAVAESADVADAVLRRKASQAVAPTVVFRLSCYSVDVKRLLLESPELEECRERVTSAGYEIQPEWANGAILLVPMTAEHANQTKLELRQHHIVACSDDKDCILRALASLPCRRRPNLRIDGVTKDAVCESTLVPKSKDRADLGASTTSASSSSQQKNSDGLGNDLPEEGAARPVYSDPDLGLELCVERTFINLRPIQGTSEHSLSMHSAP